MIYSLPDLYDEQYKNYRDDLRFYNDLAQDYGSPVLELGAGTARVSLSLAKAGHRVKGIELSEAMIQKATKRIEDANLSNKITLECSDMRDFDLGETFPLIIAPFNALMHLYTLKDQDNAFASVRKHLAKGGLFAFDLYNPNFENLEQLTKVDEWDSVGGDNSDLFLYQSDDRDKQVVTSTYYLDSVNEEGFLQRNKAVLTQRYYYRFELERALMQAGFQHLRIFGDFDRSRYETTARHLIVLAS